jgi:predicted nucleic acid-binding protein
MDMLRYGLPTVNAHELMDDALAIALATGRTVYDAIYVALAVRKKCQLVTADERLVNALATHWPVKWLGVL